MKYNTNDYELVYNVREGDESSYRFLFVKYKPIVYNMAFKYYNDFVSSDIEFIDLLQEGYLGIQDAINAFNESHNVLFYTYVNVCIKNRMRLFCRAISNKKSIPTKYLVSLDDRSFNLNLNFNYYEDVYDGGFLDSLDYIDVVKDVIYTWNIDSCPFILRMNNFSYQEISILLDIDKSEANYKVWRVKKILRERLSKIFIDYM